MTAVQDRTLQLDFLAHGGELGRMIRAHDWSRSPLGAPEDWPQPLKTLVGLMLASDQPMFVAWGPQRALLYNDRYAEVLANKHPAALGRDVLEVWHEIRADLAPIVTQAYAGEPVHMDDIALVMERRGYPEEAHFSFSYTPVRDESGAVAGFFCQCVETTAQVFAGRRAAFRLELEERLRGLSEPRAVMQAGVDLLGRELRADRVGYGEVQPDEATVVLDSCYADGVAPLTGAFSLDGFGAHYIAPQRRGESVAIGDVALDPQHDPAAWEAIETRAFASVPLISGGRFIASLYVNFREPHRWTSEELALLNEVATRTWDAVERARAEALLRESEARFRNMADSAPVMMWVTDAEGACTYLNAQWYAFTGQTPAEAEGFGWLDATHPDDKARAERAFLAATAGQNSFRVEYRLRRADGVYRWAIDAAEPRFSDAGVFLGFVGSVIDIDERREAELALATGEERLRLAVDNADIGFWDVDLVHDLLIWPPRTKAMFGISADVPVTMQDFYDGLHPDDAEATAAAFVAAADPEQRALYDVEYRTIGKEDGVVRWVAAKGRGLFDEATGRCVRVLGTAIDITERRATERALRESEARLRFLDALGAATGSLLDADAVLAATTHLLGEHMKVSICAYADMDDDEDGFTIRGDWAAPGSSSIVGHYSLAAFGKLALRMLRAGEPLVINDNRAELEPEAAATFQAIGITATICMPLVKEGRLTALMAIHDRAPRVWTEAELSLLREVTSRSWAHVERVGATAELRASEEFNRRVLASSADCIKVLDFDGHVEFMSEGGMGVMEVEDFAAVRGACWPEFWEGEEREKAQAAVEQAKSGGTGRFQGFARTLKGTPRWWDVAVTPINGATGVPEKLLAVSRDTTDQRVAEERLRELNDTLEQQVAERTAERDRMWQTSPDLMVVIDFAGVLRRVNPAWTELLGYRAEELIGHRFDEFVVPEDHAASKEALAMTAAGGQPVIENRYRHKDGSVRSISWVTAPAENVTYATGRDVTAERERQAAFAAAEAARREADALYRAYFENTAEALFVVNVLDDGGFTIEDLNPAHQASIGLPLLEVQGKRIDEILPPHVAEPVVAHYAKAIALGGAYQYREMFELHHGPTYWDTVLVPVRDGSGRVVRLIGSSRDLTRQMAAEEQLRQSQKMEAMGQLTGGVAHDFNNLLTPIMGSLDMLMRRGLGSEREQRLIDGAMQSAERAKTLVQRLLAFARRQPLQATAVDLEALVNGMAGLVGSTLGPKVEIRVELDDDLPPARADANQLEMALLNLAVNARDAMPDGGTLTIAASRQSVRDGDAAKLRQGHYVRLSVTDSGTGMDAATLARAIEPFFSTKGIGKGTGLGLSMVHGLAAQLGGGLTMTSTPGVGTTVELWLPISIEPLDGGAAAPDAAPEASARGVVLLVDDEELVRMSTADMLADLGYDVMEAGSAEDALKLLREGPVPDMLVTDHLMPGMSGAELAQAARALAPELPILLVSGYAEVDGIAPDLPRLTKPFRNAELAERLAALMQG